MKKHYRTILVLSWTLLFAGGGCASVSRILELDLAGDSEADVSDDPVADAAMRLRQPASSDEGSSESGAWGSRYSSPAADTISYGMDMHEVSSIWGEPGSIDSAGDPREGNQRWTYYSGLSSRYGLGSKRVVYFENGRVAGWRTTQ
jgi:hypothetical protein